MEIDLWAEAIVFIDTGGSTTTTALRSGKYLRAIIDETMRSSPSTPAGGCRAQDPASIAKGEIFIVDGNVIPSGMQMGVTNYALQQDEKIFPEPYRFLPDKCQ
ncbi:hypothetical protein DM02DRAFT_661804 [Periconia macrospinosa]|uniref:Uncharacterized protein n=1 Tax=Periconia macrospinosa TaxID=97972 RepID=A0A2V1D6C2_9PLEO|nr:hypothetical protein DM02DRAFT_661804 [Periconia macrospinosa]